MVLMMKSNDDMIMLTSSWCNTMEWIIRNSSELLEGVGGDTSCVADTCVKLLVQLLETIPMIDLYP